MAQRIRLGLTRRAAKECIEAAIAAPSIYNTQPWRFRIRDDGFDVYADRSRMLEVVDPAGRELLLSVGAALLNLRVAVLSRGRVPVGRLLPGDEPDLAARIRIGAAIAPSHTVRALVEAVPKRRTNRAPYAATAIPAAVFDELRAAAAAEGATLRLLDPVRRNAFFAVARTAQRMDDDPGYLHELSAWTDDTPCRRDGLPPTTIAFHDKSGALPLRDFGAAQPPGRLRIVPFEAHPQIALLSTQGDGAREWLRAGQALQRLLLTATVRSISAQLLTQPLEDPCLRSLLSDHNTGRFAQVALRLGYGPPVGAAAPRRLLTDVLLGRMAESS